MYYIISSFILLYAYVRSSVSLQFALNSRLSLSPLQVLLLQSLTAYLLLRPNLSDADLVAVLSDLQQRLERTESGGQLVALVDALSALSEWRPRVFETSFQDVVDILIGWHLGRVSKRKKILTNLNGLSIFELPRA